MMPALGYISLIGIVALGVIVVRFFGANKPNRLELLLAFSGAYLLGIASLHLIPEVFASDIQKVGYYVLAGFLLQVFLDYLSGGLEHGHTHIHIKTIPYAAILGLCIHAFVEGIPLAAELHPESISMDAVDIHHGHDHGHSHAHHHDPEDDNASGGYPLLIALLVHKLPVAVALTGMLIGCGFGWKKTWLILGVFSLAAPLGAYFGLVGLGNIEYLTIALAVALGSFLHVSTTIIFESASDHKLNLGKLMAVIFGFAIAALTLEVHLI